MRNGIFSLATAFTLFVALTGSALAQPAYQNQLTTAFPADGPGAAAIVVKDSQVLFKGASGMANIELGVPLSAESVFRLGSISKQFTAAGIMLLAERGQLSVTDDITSYLPDYPTHGHVITIAQLMAHTSGIFNYTAIPGYWEGVEIRRDVTTDELIDVFAHQPMDFAPGESFRYSNSGYVLLGAIIEKVSGKTYADFIQTEIFDPLEMKNSHHGGLQIIPNRVAGYAGADGDYRNAGFISMTQPHGAGALLSTVGDLARWNASLFGHELLSKDSVDEMSTGFVLKNGESIGYGYGLGVGKRFGTDVISHNGGIHGFSTSGVWLPAHRIYVAVLSNLENSQAPDYLATRMALDAAGIDYPRFEPIEPNADEWAEFVGVYRISGDETRAVLLEDGRLYTRRSGDPMEILPYAKDRFFYPGSFTHLTFVRDENGRVTAMEMYHDGSEEPEPAEKISDVIEPEDTGQQ